MSDDFSARWDAADGPPVPDRLVAEAMAKVDPTKEFAVHDHVRWVDGRLGLPWTDFSIERDDHEDEQGARRRFAAAYLELLQQSEDERNRVAAAMIARGYVPISKRQ